MAKRSPRSLPRSHPDYGKGSGSMTPEDQQAALALQEGSITIVAQGLDGLSEEGMAKIRADFEARALKAGDPLIFLGPGSRNGLYFPTRQSGPVRRDEKRPGLAVNVYAIDRTKPGFKGQFLGREDDLSECNSQVCLHGYEGIEAGPGVLVESAIDQVAGYLPPFATFKDMSRRDGAAFVTGRIGAFAGILVGQDRQKITRQAGEVPQIQSSRFANFELMRQAGTVIPLDKGRAYNATSGIDGPHRDVRNLPARIILIQGYGWVVMGENIKRNFPREYRLLESGATPEIAPGEMRRSLTPAAQLGNEEQAEAAFFFHHAGLTGEKPPAVFLPLDKNCKALEITLKDDDVKSRWMLLQDIAGTTVNMTMHNALESPPEDEAETEGRVSRWISGLLGRR